MHFNDIIWYNSLLLLSLSSAYSATAVTRPNILIIQADDMGFDDLSIHGNTVIETPALDQLSSTSVSFDRFYVHSVSAPTRASLLTGKHFWKTGVSGVHAGRDFLHLDEVIAPQIFQENGYATGMWGKWHSGKTEGYFPWNRGFDEAYMASLYGHVNNNGKLNGIDTPLTGWTDSIMANYAIEFIERNKETPFYAYLSFLAPHGKWDANPTYVQKYRDKGLSDNFAVLCAMIDHLSVQTGRVIAKLDELELTENTIIIFLSDNGPALNVDGNSITESEWILRNPSYMRGNKSTNWDNGIRSPLIISWKGKFRTHRDLNPVCISDILPTLFDLCEIQQNKIHCDGISLRNHLENVCFEAEKRNIFIAQWHPIFNIDNRKVNNAYLPLSTTNRASINFEDQVIGVYRNEMKLMLNHKQELPLVLKNTVVDPYEKLDFASKNEVVVDELYASLSDWFEDIYNNPHAFTMPRFIIRKTIESEILAYAPIAYSEGLNNNTHSLDNWSKANDFARYQIRVEEPGFYDLVLVSKSTVTSGNATFTVSANGNSLSTSISDTQSPKAELYLSAGNYNLEMKLNNAQSAAFVMASIRLNFIR